MSKISNSEYLKKINELESENTKLSKQLDDLGKMLTIKEVRMLRVIILLLKTIHVDEYGNGQIQDAIELIKKSYGLK